VKKQGIIDDVYLKAKDRGLDIDAISDRNFILNFSGKLRAIERGRKVHLPAAASHRFRAMGLLSDGFLTELGVKALKELEEDKP